MTLPRYDDWLDNHGLPGIDDGEDIMCQCKHPDHTTNYCENPDLTSKCPRGECIDCPAIFTRDDTNHTYRGVLAGEQRAHLTGPICDVCAEHHMSGYLLRD